MQGLIAREQRFTERHPSLYPAAVQLHRIRRRLRWMRTSATWASARTAERLPVRIKRHKSLLRRTLSDDEMHLQDGKVRNLELASARLDGLLIRPGETVSFNRVVGNCTRRKGYVDGMRLSNGEALSGVGGGICQLANLLHWMVLHSPMTVTERSEHSFDPFPDNGRVLPWGTGCSIVYNYVDLCFRNDTDITFALSVRVGERYLEGELRASATPEHSYSVFARDETFLRLGGEYFRRNEIWRTVIDRRVGVQIGEELVRRNCALVRYVPTGVDVQDITPLDGRVGDPRAA
ncbi:VanW family protein [Solicola gregarius]|uniref:VanW family protein n=1 Tax=Solicola gregarius TaxID=2908642 RepID=A0AA46TIX6_9ACTN|nr:VanW family protein [Solicola gregarius]UYM05719.1 VanW family protein [Solicola gregarius]